MSFQALDDTQTQAIADTLRVGIGEIELVIVYSPNADPAVYVPRSLGHTHSTDTTIPFSQVSSRILTSKQDVSSCGEGKRKVVVDTANAIEAVCAGCS